MVAAGALVGLGSSAYWTFGVEHVTDAGLSVSAGRAFLGAAGIACVLAIGTSDLARRVGAQRAFALLTATEAAAVGLLAVAASSPLAVFASAIAFGAAYPAAVGVTAIWSTTLFADRPSLGVAAAMTASGTGLMLGPLAAGLLTGALGLRGVLLLGALVIAGAGGLGPRTPIL
jgi:predicted MFS family arabinose efflux permease